MGIGIVLIVYFVVLSVAATICSAILVAATRWYLRENPSGRKKLMTYAGLLPFAYVVYAGIWFIGYAVINDSVFHRDPMLGDGWYTPIGHGYAIDMIDVTDQGSVHPTDGPDRGLNSPDGVRGVRRMQVAGNYIFGTEDKSWFGNLGTEKSTETNFFAIDTQIHAKKEFASESELADFAKQNGATLALRPIADVYQSYRMTWFEPVAGLMLVSPPGAAFCLLVWRIVRLKRAAMTNATSAAG